jgi:uncharacterized protein Yka (UPF0111/DUF47 family)
MNTARNDITNDLIKSKAFSKQGRDNYDFIFKKRMKKLILATANFCGPCRVLKSRIEKEGLSDRVEIKIMEDEIDFFRENVIKSVPQLLIFTEDEDQVIIIKGSDEILNAIKEQ